MIRPPDELVSDMLSFAEDNETQELNLEIVKSDQQTKSRILPSKVFSFSHLTSLRIKGLGLECQDLVLCCPLIREFSLSTYSRLTMIRCGGAQLKHVELDTVGLLEKVDIDPDVSLESFSHTGLYGIHDINLENQKQSLKYLEFKDQIFFSDQWFEDNISPCTLLETIKLFGK